jgi:hypothetical protein
VEHGVAAGRVVRRGRQLMVCLGEVFAEKDKSRKQVALMTASMMVVDVATGVCTENLNEDVMMMEPAEERM